MTTPPGHCHWHNGPSGTAVVVRIVEQASGPGHALYACAPCREQRNLTPIAEQSDSAAYSAYIQHTQSCRACGVVRRCQPGEKLWEAYRAALAAC